MMRMIVATMTTAGIAILGGCKPDSASKQQAPQKQHAQDDHVHTDGSVHPDDHAGGGGHHDEVGIGTVEIGALTVSLAQGHGRVVAGKEGHLVVKLPYNDKGATVVRAWLGTHDRTASYVGKGEYAPSHDDYDVHTIAPDPLPGNVMWWIEIQKPDGTKVVGSAKPILD